MRYVEKERILKVLTQSVFEGWIDENINIPDIKLEAYANAADEHIRELAAFLKKEAASKEVFDTQELQFKTIYIFKINAGRLFAFAESLPPQSEFRKELLLRLTTYALRKLELEVK